MSPAPTSRRLEALACVIVCLGLALVYLPASVLTGESVIEGIDYDRLHRFRLELARAALIHSGLPAWNPQELLGAPFLANLQSFPWVPQRLLLLAIDPAVAFAPAVLLSAWLAALGMYGFSRRAGLSLAGAAVAGFTFAASGYYASRIAAGHLPLLEAYPLLPFALWVVEAGAAGALTRAHLLALGALGAAASVAGHPQVPAYALIGAVLYAALRIGWRRGAAVLGALSLGVLVAAPIWLPFVRLIGRSTRVLPLAPTNNDVVLPYSRLAAFFLPSIHGWAEPVADAETHPWTESLRLEVFWDTVAYVGLAPWLALLLLAVLAARRRARLSPRATALVLIGVGALVLALPLGTWWRDALPVTIFRSPARQLYLTVFALAYALGAGLTQLEALVPKGALVAIVLGALHGLDVGRIANKFVAPMPRQQPVFPRLEALYRTHRPGQRVAVDRNLAFQNVRVINDLGIFDSLLLARPYAGLLAMSGARKGLNTQRLHGSQLSLATLRLGGVEWVVTPHQRPDLPKLFSEGPLNIYQVVDPEPAARFYAPAAIKRLDEGEQREKLRTLKSFEELWLPPREEEPTPAEPGAERALHWSRPDADTIKIELEPGPAGYVRLNEAYDEGWTATIDGAAARIEPAYTFAQAVPVPTGARELVLHYETPGVGAGLLISLVALLAWLATARRLAR